MKNEEIYFVTELDYVATSNIRSQIKKKSSNANRGNFSS